MVQVRRDEVVQLLESDCARRRARKLLLKRFQSCTVVEVEVRYLRVEVESYSGGCVLKQL